MDSTKRIIVNTIVQYAKAVFTTVISLYSTRLILDALSISDFGIYSVIGGVVTMLGFITNALVITTQRYISYYYGKEELDTVKIIFSNSLFLHLIIGVFLCLILLSLQGWLMHNILIIPENRMDTANYVYIITCFMLFVTIMTAPFKALFIARENIIYIAILEMVDALIKLILAIGLAFIQSDKLLFYAIVMGGIVLFNIIAFAVYALYNFSECSIVIHRKDINKTRMKQLTGFAGWVTYGMGAIAGRNQGTAIVLNHFFGTTINAAYGIAFQVNGAVAFIVTSILNAMNPQIMKSEGNNDREHMLKLASMESKYSVALLAIVTLPLIIEMSDILEVWLNNVPPYTCIFCQFILIGFICDQLTLGLQTANQAIGNLRNYTLLVYTPKVLYLPLIWIMFKCGCSIEASMWLFVTIELCVAMSRIIYTNHITKLNILQYFKSVILPQIPIWTSILIIGLPLTLWLQQPYRFPLTYFFAATGGIFAAWHFTLAKEERVYINQLIKKQLRHG